MTELIKQTQPTALRIPEVIEKLREKAQKDKLFNALCYMFALRERARQRVTVPTMFVTLNKEGYKCSKEDCENILSFLATLGLGVLHYSPSGRIAALRNIHVTLQSIGLAAISKSNDLRKFKMPPKFKSLVSKEAAKEIKSTPKLPEPLTYPITLMAKIHGVPVTFAGPFYLSPEELGPVLLKFNTLMAEHSKGGSV